MFIPQVSHGLFEDKMKTKMSDTKQKLLSFLKILKVDKNCNYATSFSFKIWTHYHQP